jgi:uncharacterized SAM-binding protein YcdF (DUF218 family)
MLSQVFTRKRCLQILSGFAGLLFLVATAAFAFPQQVLCVDSGNVVGEALVVLGGGSYERPVRAAELFRAHAAPRVIVTGEGDYETNRRLLQQAGVPAGAIILEPKAKSTRENALDTIPILRERGVRDVILVTSWYHSRRALRCFSHYAPDIRFYSRPAYFAFPRSEWRRQGMYRYIRTEYAKLVAYWLRYGVSPV